MMTKQYVKRLYECYTCEYFETCMKTIDIPEDYPDGWCKTKSLIFEKGFKANDKSLMHWKS